MAIKIGNIIADGTLRITLWGKGTSHTHGLVVSAIPVLGSSYGNIGFDTAYYSDFTSGLAAIYSTGLKLDNQIYCYTRIN